MKKIILSFLALAMSAVAMADDVVLLDSTYQKLPNGELIGKQFYSYDKDGKMLTDETADKDGNVELYNKYIYNADGLVECIETYIKNNVSGEFLKVGYYEYGNFVDGVSTEYFSHDYDKDTGEYIERGYMKVVKVENGVPTELEIYTRDDEKNEWKLGARHIFTLNDKGQIVKTVKNIYAEGMEAVDVETFEYDDHGYETVRITTFEAHGTTRTSVRKHEYEYGIYDKPVKVTNYVKMDDDSPMECTYVEEMFYSSIHTGIDGILAPAQSSSVIYDMTGCEASNAFRGIVIQNGRKMLKK